MSPNQENKILSKIRGTVVSKKNSKTAVVLVSAFKTHSKYKKKIKITKKYQIHDEENRLKEGDVVEMVAIRPMSKRKKFKAI